MGQYILRRLLMMIPVLVGVSVLVFCLARILPGDVFIAQNATSGGIDPATRAKLRHQAGLDRPLAEQYFDWAGHAVVLDFGDSLFNRRPVNEELKRAVPITLELTILAAAIGLIIAIPFGTISAVMRGTAVDYLVRFLCVLGLSVPSFVLGTLTVAYLAIWWQWAPPSGTRSLFEEPWPNIQQFIFPATILGLSFAASVMRMTRSTVLGVLREDYVRTARSKGIRQRAILMRHVLKNALLPVMTLAGTQIGVLLGGSVIMENLFTLNGMGKLAFDAITNRDYFILQSVALVAAVVFTVVNLLVDLSYGWLDPRIRLS
jgi:peptide/nickel transport system permease protein